MAQISKEVCAIEADPNACIFFEENWMCNPDLANKISLFPLALSDNSGTVNIMTGGGSGSSILEVIQEGNPKIPTVAVRCVTFKEFLSLSGIAAEEIGFIKMDIEGAEKFCIPDMEWFLKDYRGAMCLSLHSGFITEAELQNIIDIMNRYFKRISTEGWIRS